MVFITPVVEHWLDEKQFRGQNYIVLNFQYLQIKNVNTASTSDTVKKLDDRLEKTETLVSSSTLIHWKAFFLDKIRERDVAPW